MRQVARDICWANHVNVRKNLTFWQKCIVSIHFQVSDFGQSVTKHYTLHSTRSRSAGMQPRLSAPIATRKTTPIRYHRPSDGTLQSMMIMIVVIIWIVVRGVLRVVSMMPGTGWVKSLFSLRSTQPANPAAPSTRHVPVAGPLTRHREGQIEVVGRRAQIERTGPLLGGAT